MSISHQSSFSRTLANEGKMGAYYTDVGHCLDIGKMFHFPEDEEVSVLEPSIGDGAAVIAVTGAEHNPNIKIFGVELNDVVADATKKNPLIEECLKADFLNGVRISNNAFSFCFGNPPYMTDRMDGDSERTERQFLEKVGYYLKKDGILVWVIPYSVYTEESYFRYFNSRYELLHCFRFREREYDKYHQLVLVAKKRSFLVSFQKDKFISMLAAVDDEDKIPELPDSFTEKIPVPCSDSKEISLFAPKEFDLDAAYANLDNQMPPALCKVFDKKVSVPHYLVTSMGRPLIPLKKDSMYLLATSGGGQGLTGSEETNDLHLQRGVAEIIEENQLEYKGDKTVCRSTTRTQVTMTIVQNNGKITSLT